MGDLHDAFGNRGCAPNLGGFVHVYPAKAEPNMKHILALALCAALLAGCRKDQEDSAPSPTTAGQSSTAALRAHFAQQRQAEIQTFTFSGAGGGYFTTAHGTLLCVAPFAFRDAAGTPVAGTVTVEVVEAYTVSDMLRLNLQTMAVGGDQRTPLQSGGELRLRATSGGQQVTVAEEGVLIHIPEQVPVPGMLSYTGEEDSDGIVRWGETGEELLDTMIIYPDNTGAMQVADSGYFNWWPPAPPLWPQYTFFNIDHPLPITGAGTDVTVNLTNVPEVSGTWVFLVLPELDCMIYFEVGPTNARRAGCAVPVGAQGTLVAMSLASGNQVHAAFVPVTVTQDMQQSITLQPMTQAAYDAAVEAL